MPVRSFPLLLLMTFIGASPLAGWGADFPDPLTCQDGTAVSTVEAWTQRRAPELRELFQRVQYGRLPPPPARVESTVASTTEAFGGKAELRRVTLTWGIPGPAIHLWLFTPKGVASAPTFLGLTFMDPREALPGEKKEGVWNIERTLARGYAVALFWTADVVPDQADTARERLKSFRPAERADAPADDDCATLAAWAWGLMRAMDYLAAAPGVDARRVAVVGHSRNGKAALLAGALDTRFALVIASQAGCGGTAPSRVAPALAAPGPDGRPTAETLAMINASFPHWFCANFKRYDADPSALPVDQHELIALCAPRPVLVSAATLDAWANPDGQFAMLQAADPVYRLVAGEGLAVHERPAPLAPARGRLAYYLRPGAHEMNAPDWAAWLDYADYWLKGG